MKSSLPILLAITCLFTGSDSSAQSAEVLEPWRAEEHRQFDFWIGKWDVNLRTIQSDNTWKDSIKAKADIHSILDGKAILELWDSPTIKGFSLRYFDIEKNRWVLYLNWPSNSQSNVGSLQGQFRHGRGEFYSGPAIGETPATGPGTISRYTFCDITPESLRWDDADSKDGGKTWTNNWIMEFSRTAKLATWPENNLAHTFETGKRCVGETFEALNSMGGNWEGTATIHTSAGTLEAQAKMRVFHVLDGCTMLRFLEFEVGSNTVRSFGLLTYNTGRRAFEELSLDNSPASVARLSHGYLDGSAMELTATNPEQGPKALHRRVWTLPLDEDQLKLESSHSSDGEEWTPSISVTFTPAP